MKVIAIGFVVLCILVWIALNRLRAKREVAANGIGPKELYALLKAQKVLLYDVRQPLDVLAHPEIIPGAIRITPKGSTISGFQSDPGLSAQFLPCPYISIMGSVALTS